MGRISIRAASNLESAGDYPGALKKYEQAAAIDPQYAELQFRAGTLPACADEFRTRPWPILNWPGMMTRWLFVPTAALMESSKTRRKRRRTRVFIFLMPLKRWRRASPAGIPGNELFYEHVHLNFDGNYLLGRAFAEQTLKLLPKSILAQGKTGWASAELCDRRLAVSPWDRFRVWQENYSRVSEPPFTDQLNDVPRAKFYMAKLQELNSQMTDRNPRAIPRHLRGSTGFKSQRLLFCAKISRNF